MPTFVHTEKCDGCKGPPGDLNSPLLFTEAYVTLPTI